VIGGGRFSRDVAWNLGGLAVLGLGGIAINTVILGVQGAEALGIFNQVFAIYIVVSQFCVGGIHLSTLKHCSERQQDPAACGAIARSALLAAMPPAFLFAGILWLLAAPIGELLSSPEVGEGLLYAAPGLVFFALNKILLATLNGMRRMRFFAIMQSLRYLGILAGVLVIALSGGPSALLPLALTAAELVLFFALLATLGRVLLAASPEAEPLVARIRRHLSFGLRGLFSGILVEANSRVDIVMLGYFTTNELVGVYSFAAILAEGFAQILVVVRQNFDPVAGACFAEKRPERIPELARRVRRILWPLFTMGVIILIDLYLPMIYLLGDSSAASGWGVLVILLAGLAISAGYRPFEGIIYQGGRPGMYTLLLLSTVTVNIVLNLAMIPVWGIPGAAVATSISFVWHAVAVVVLVRRLFGLRLI
jgi:O-antigen/teichoic acid export membrane protein